MNEEKNSALCCPICGAVDSPLVVEVTEMPVHCHLLWPERSAAMDVPRGVICLRYCRYCQHIYNQAFDPNLMAYSQEYDNSLHFSPRFQKYAYALAEKLVQRYELQGKRIVEIGSGKGDFLTMLCRLGGATGIGFDPSYEPDPDHQDENVTFIQDFFSDKYANDLEADFICCRHVLEHIEQPESFVQMIRRTMGKQRDVTIFFEVPNSLHTIHSLAIWDIIYEHFSYFSPQSLGHLFRQNGFTIIDIAETFGGQFLTLEAQSNGVNARRKAWENSPNFLYDLEVEVATFAINHRRKVSAWQQHLEQLADMGKKAVVWGAGSKGVTYLNLLQGFGNIQYVVDINPRKQGMFVTSSGQEIVSPDFLLTYKPDVVILLNANYKEEIAGVLNRMNLTSEIMLA